jgi:hypothetical protein
VHVVEAVVEMVPDLPGAGAEQKEVIQVFIQRTGEAGGRVGKVVPEAPLIGWKTLSPSKPAEDLALKGAALLQILVATSSTCRWLKVEA